MTRRPRLLFVSPRYLLPADSGGKIRTGHVLRGMKNGNFEITLLTPAPAGAPRRDAKELDDMCDRFASWPETARGRLFSYTRLRHIVSSLPISVATDWSARASELVKAALARRPDLVVIDFTHSAVLMPDPLATPSVLFTHNVEAEIFARHVEVARNPLLRAVWRDQLHKMRRFERRALHRFDTVIAVSERDRQIFASEYGIGAEVIATGVDLEFFRFTEPPADGRADLVFTASMDSYANIEGLQWFMVSVWPLIVQQLPAARLTIVGRNPQPALVRAAKERNLPWVFTGFVEDVRSYVDEAAAYIIPLRVGSGTRIKAFEAMALGCPVVSTTIGVEGLEVEPGRHYLAADTAESFATAVVNLLRDAPLRTRIAHSARKLVEDHYSFRGVAATFEAICARACEQPAVDRLAR